MFTFYTYQFTLLLAIDGNIINFQLADFPSIPYLCSPVSKFARELINFLNLKSGK
jgi:hypothetical protein